MIIVSLLLAAQAASPPATYRLRGDALVLSRAPTGIIALSGDAKLDSWISAEALIWAGAGDTELDALVATVVARHPDGIGELRAGRMLLVTGALLPVHFDGITGVARAGFGTSVEAFAGSPVVPRFDYRGGDWLVGGRVAQRFGSYGHVGLAVGHRTDDSEVADQEVALDGLFVPFDQVDVAVRAAYDIPGQGISEASLGGGVSLDPVRVTVTAQHRSPSRILPATSVFSVLGDIASNAVVATADWRVAPRLDVTATAGVRHVDAWGEELRLASTLRLDDRGRGAVGIVLTRLGAGDAGWMGARVFGRYPILEVLVVSAEAEIARTKAGDTWPWALGAIAWTITDQWEAAAAVEASASPTDEYAVQAIGRIGYTWSVR